MTNSTDSPSPPQYSVSVWEGIAIAVGAVFLVAIGMAGLIYKFFSNASDPKRATLIAQTLMDYRIPDGAQGVFGANLGGAKVAIVSSPSFPRDTTNLSPAKVKELSGVELFIARAPLDVETGAGETSADIADKRAAETYDLFSSPEVSFSYRSGEEFEVIKERLEDKQFCNLQVPVRIQEGNLSLGSQLPTVPAVKYDAIAVFNDSKRQVTLLAIGNNAAKEAATVFNSLKCK